MDKYENKVYHCDFMHTDAEPGSAMLIIADPPYFETKGEFDFVWNSFEEYLIDVERWAVKFKELLSDFGTLIYYGSADKIAYSQIILDKYFKLENNMVWNVSDHFNRRQPKGFLRNFTPVTERILIYSNYSQDEVDWKRNNATVYFDEYEVFRLYFRSEVLKIGVKKVAEYCGISTRAIDHYTCKSQWNFPSENNYKKIQELGIFEIEYEILFERFKTVRAEHWQLKANFYRRPFNNILDLTDVVTFSRQTNISAKYDHPTQKPEELTRAFMLSCSNEEDNIFIPFSGSGTEPAMAVKENRFFKAYDLNIKYVKMSNDRVSEILKTPTLF